MKLLGLVVCARLGPWMKQHSCGPASIRYQEPPLGSDPCSYAGTRHFPSVSLLHSFSAVLEAVGP